jgi:hypothetical protein
MFEHLPATSAAGEMLSGLTDQQVKRLTKLLDIRRARITFATEHHVNTRGDRMDFAHYPHIKALYNSLASTIVLQGSVQSFKAQPLTAKVHTPSGWKLMGDLRVGDTVSTPDGANACITAVQPQGTVRIYKLKFSDGRVVEACGDHLWKVRGSRRIFKACRGLCYDAPKASEVVDTNTIAKRMCSGERFSVPLTLPVEKPATSVTLDPYFVGLMLGDGELGKTNLRFITTESELVTAVNASVYRWGLKLQQYKDTANHHFIRGENSISNLGAQLLRDQFEKLRLLGTDSFSKFIPASYKEGSIEQRLALLQGLMDTDGVTGSTEIRISSKQLALDIQEIVWSLGGVASITPRETYYTKEGGKVAGATSFIVAISHPHPSMLYRLTSKRAAVSDDHRRTDTMGPTIEEIICVGEKPAQCIVLDHPEHLYLTDGYTVTHNSEWAVIDHFAAAFTGLSVFFVVPKYEARTTYVQNRINKCVQSVPEYKRIIGAGFFDSVQMKSFGKGSVKYVGSNVLADFKEYPADMIVVEEVDQCDKDNVAYANDRLMASPYQFKRYLGNPTHKGKGINAYFQESDQREWYVPCMICGEYSELDWFNVVVEAIFDKEGHIVDYRLRDKEWSVGCRRDIHLMCPKCSGQLERASDRGEWRPKNQGHPIEGYHISQLCSPINSVASMWQEFRASLTDPTRLQKFYNSYLGLPFEAAGNKITSELLAACSDLDYKFVIQPDCAFISGDGDEGPCSMGVDVGGNLDVRISRIEKNKRRAVYMGKVKHIDEVYSLIERYNVEKCVIDSGPETALVQDFQDNATCDVWACRYGSEGSDKRRRYDTSDKVISIDRTEALDRSFSQIRQKKNILPVNFTEILDGQYVSEMCDPVRSMVEDDRGNSKFEWTKCKDHQRHCDTYDMLAAQLIMEATLDDISIG